MSPQSIIAAVLVACMSGSAAVPAGEVKDINASAREAVLPLMKKAADRQLKTMEGKEYGDWVCAVFYAGLASLYDITRDETYGGALVRIGNKNKWSLGKNIYHADNQAVAQMYIDLCRSTGNRTYIENTQKAFDTILSRPEDRPYAQWTQNEWSWCDALFMAPPAWVRLWNMTDDRRYLDFMDRGWWKTSDYLYSTNHHLYFRDARFFTKTAANGMPVFWSRGNGWVFAGLARVLQFLPADHPNRNRYETQFREMAEAIAQQQGADGLWRTSLLDAAQYPERETSGTGLFCYGFAWGVNSGLLAAERYRPVVEKAWRGLCSCIGADGSLRFVQLVADRPGAANASDTAPYGTGALLLAGTEIIRGSYTVEAPASAGSNDDVQLRSAGSVFAGFFPGRDDMAWENDRTAFRIYGPALKAQPEDSGIDCWLKRVNYPIVEKWYAEMAKGKSYHKDNGEGYDPYHVGKTRGCGGTAVWKNGRMYLSDVFSAHRIIENASDHASFEVTYRFDVDGEIIDEVKTISIRQGSQLFISESTFTSMGAPAKVTVAVGITTHNGAGRGIIDTNRGYAAVWETIDGFGLGTGVKTDPASICGVYEIKSNVKDESHVVLLITPDARGRTRHAAGFGWAKAGAITSPALWEGYLAAFDVVSGTPPPGYPVAATPAKPAVRSSSMNGITVTASAHDGNAPVNTLDGDVATRWSAEGKDQWIMYDFGAARNIIGISIMWFQGKERSTSFAVELSDDGAAWREVFAGASARKAERETYTFTEQQNARFLRLHCHGNTKNAWNSICEVIFR